MCLYDPTLGILLNVCHDSPVLSIPFSSPRFRAAFTAHTRPESPSRISFLLLSMSRRPLPPTIPYVRRRCAAPRFSPRVRARLTLQAASVRMRPAFQLHLQRLPRPVPAAASAPAGRMVPCRRCGCAFRPWRAAGGDSQLFFGTVSCVRRQWASKSAKPLWPDVSVWSVFVARSAGYGQRRAGSQLKKPGGAGRANSGAPFPYTMSRRSRGAPGE